MRQLSYLVALDRHRHFARAAESCHVSQPALSAGISELERELGVTIIRRNRSFQGITPEGERVLAWARQVLSSLDGLRQEAALVRAVPSGHLAIGSIPSAIQAVTLLAAELRQAIPDLTLEVHSLSADEILRRLSKQELHFGMTYGKSVGGHDHDVVHLYEERCVLLARADATLPGVMSWADVTSLPLCLLTRDMHGRQIIDQAFLEAGTTPRIVLETNAIEVLLSETRSGHAFTILPASVLPRRPAAPGVRVHPLVPERRSTVSLLRSRRDTQLPVSEIAWTLAGTLDLRREFDDPLR